MTDIVSESETPRRFNTGIISAFALGALALAITGIYAVVAFSVSLRAQEIAIRMALGAERQNIARLVLVSAAKIAVFGCGVGVLASFAVSQLVSSFLFGVTAVSYTHLDVYKRQILIAAASQSARRRPRYQGPGRFAASRKLRSTMSFGSVETGPSRHNQRIMSGKIAPPIFWPCRFMPHA